MDGDDTAPAAPAAAGGFASGGGFAGFGATGNAAPANGSAFGATPAFGASASSGGSAFGSGAGVPAQAFGGGGFGSGSGAAAPAFGSGAFGSGSGAAAPAFGGGAAAPAFGGGAAAPAFGGFNAGAASAAPPLRGRSPKRCRSGRSESKASDGTAHAAASNTWKAGGSGGGFGSTGGGGDDAGEGGGRVSAGVRKRGASCGAFSPISCSPPKTPPTTARGPAPDLHNQRLIKWLPGYGYCLGTVARGGRECRVDFGDDKNHPWHIYMPAAEVEKLVVEDLRVATKRPDTKVVRSACGKWFCIAAEDETPMLLRKVSEAVGECLKLSASDIVRMNRGQYPDLTQTSKLEKNTIIFLGGGTDSAESGTCSGSGSEGRSHSGLQRTGPGEVGRAACAFVQTHCSICTAGDSRKPCTSSYLSQVLGKWLLARYPDGYPILSGLGFVERVRQQVLNLLKNPQSRTPLIGQSLSAGGIGFSFALPKRTTRTPNPFFSCVNSTLLALHIADHH